MDKYKNFSIEDFLQDEFFFQWVKNPFSKDGELWERWLQQHPEMWEVVEESKNILLAFDNGPANPGDDFYVQLKKRIDSTIADEENKKETFFFVSWLKLVAIVITLIITGSIIFYSLSDAGFTEYSTTYAQTKKVFLPDGSEVMLNANSFLRYKESPNKKRREVWLKGEGFFDIKHLENPDKVPVKFIVHAQEVIVEVMGTQFNVNNIDENKTEVLLTKGKVRLSVSEENNRPVNMAPGNLVLYNNKTESLSLNKVSAENYIAWMYHKYIFEKTTLEEVSKALSRYYGKPIFFRDTKMGKQQLSGTLELQDEETLIQTLSVILGVPVYKNGNQIVVGSK